MKISELRSYEILEERWIDDIHSQSYVIRHKKSGARVAVLSNDDDNKVFYIGFRTPPEDSTGVAHIIEHTVLCGSEKYPVKDPFVELVKGSLNTFLNAMTYPDKTIYPVASTNDTDFQNLMGVYMDAVFHPNIYKYREIFEQEGWHYELEDEESPIRINGVVYNEMKGAFSAPDDVVQREIMSSLFPDTAYGFESGGDPDHIPELTYEQYLEFHRRYYHPSNSYIYMYGDMDIVEKLQWMDEEYLGKYDAISLDSSIKIQPPFDEPREVTRYYSVSSTDPEEDATYLSLNFAVGSVLDRKLYQAFDVLDYALIGAPGAPVKKALIEAGIGKDIVGGYDNGSLQPTFSFIAKNANLSDKDRFLSVIHEVLKEQVENGLDKKALLAEISGSEFRFREADYGQFPKGLLYGIQCLDSWLYDDMHPFMHLEALDTYRFLRDMVDTDYYEKLIQEYLLDNTHASIVNVVPKKGLNAQKDAELEKKLSDYKSELSPDEIQKLIADTRRLREYQEEPSSREDLEKIPMLTRSDMRRECNALNNRVVDCDGTSFVHHCMYSSGIDYVTLMFDIKDFPIEDLPYVGILKAVLGYVDTESYTYGELANEINIYTGGIASSVGIYPHRKKRDVMEVTYEVRVKVLSDKINEAMDLIREIILTSKISDEKRLGEIMAQLKARLQTGLSSAGHSVASTRAMSYVSRCAFYQDATGGIACFKVIEDYENSFAEKKQELIDKFTDIIRRIFTGDRMMVSVTCDENDFDAVKAAVLKLRPMLYEEKNTSGRELPHWEAKCLNEGFMDASQVQYVARAGNFADHGYKYHGALRILKVIMGYDYLWTSIRVKGGAYGCMNGYMPNGDTYFVSYRDPNLAETNAVYDGIPDYMKSFSADEREMTKYIIGTVSDMDTPLNPYAKGSRSMTAYMQGVTEEDLQAERNQVIDATPDDIRGLCGLVESVLSDGALCAIGNEEKLGSEKQLFNRLEYLCS